MRGLKIRFSGALLLEMFGIHDAQKIEAHYACVDERDVVSIIFAGDDPRLPEWRSVNSCPEGLIECTLKSERPDVEGRFVVEKEVAPGG